MGCKIIELKVILQSNINVATKTLACETFEVKIFHLRNIYQDTVNHENDENLFLLSEHASYCIIFKEARYNMRVTRSNQSDSTFPNQKSKF